MGGKAVSCIDLKLLSRIHILREQTTFLTAYISASTGSIALQSVIDGHRFIVNKDDMITVVYILLLLLY